MDVIYLDYNCFQRGFDDHRQIRIQMEALACHEIFIRAEQEQVRLVWSFMHEDETMLCPFPERKYAVLHLAPLCKIRVGPDEQISNFAKTLQNRGGFSSKDALHLSCAAHVNADAFLTCDDLLLKRAQRIQFAMTVVNPVDYIRKGAS